MPDVAPKKTVERSPTFRRIAADTFGVRLSDNWAEVIFSIQSGDVDDQERVVQEVSIVMTHRALKVLNRSLTGAVAHAEKTLGPIKLPDAPTKDDT